MNSETQSPSIYVIDDDADDFMILSDLILEKWQINMQHFELPSDFLNNVKSLPLPDLIVLDINMPVVSGFGVIRFLKQTEKWKDIPVVFLSTASDDEQIRKAKSLGAYEYFVKPSTIEQWQAVIHKLELMDLLTAKNH
jgi:CheY-like chemotaxis protein